MNRNYLGYDVYEIDCINISFYIDLLTNHKIQLYHLKKVDTYTYQFCIKRHAIYKLQKLDIPIRYLKSVGPLYYLTLLLKSKVKWLGIITFIIVYIYTKQHLLNIKITGTQYQLNEQIVEKLSFYHINFFDKKLSLQDIENLKATLLQDFINEIDWINVYQKGETLFIEYTNKSQSDIETKDSRPLVACKESVIKEFQVQSGYIVAKINQYVTPGELLVSNAIVSTFDETILVYPKGKIFGYTWYDIEKEMPLNDEADAFNTLLMEIRNELSAIIGQEAKIDKENILLFTGDDSTIRMKVHYTVIEDVACKGDMNEQNNETDGLLS